jgi:Ca2+-binding RTX toxin-like protein
MITQRRIDRPLTDTSPTLPAGLRRCFSGLAAISLAGTWMLAGVTSANATTGVAVVNGVVTVRTVPGKSNNLDIVAWLWTPDIMIVDVWDSGDPPSAGAGCSRVESGRVWCGVPAKARIHVQSGDLNDTIVLSGVMVEAYVQAGDGNDWVAGSPQRDDLDGGPGDDFMEGRFGNDSLYGGGGNDSIHGNEGDDQLAGAEGDDGVYGGPGVEKMLGGDGDDQMYGHDGNDFAYGGAGADFMVGGQGGDELNGEEGSDQISLVDGVPFNDRAHGGAGEDLCVGDAGDVAFDCESFIEQ